MMMPKQSPKRATEGPLPQQQEGANPSKVVYSKAFAGGSHIVNNLNNTTGANYSPRTTQASPTNQRSALKAKLQSTDLSMNQNQHSLNEDISAFLKQQPTNEQLLNNTLKSQTTNSQAGINTYAKVQHPHQARVNIKQQQMGPENRGDFDLKQFRLVATDYLMSPILQNLFAKLWKLMLVYNYDRFQLKNHSELLLQIPLRIDIYEQFETLFVKGLGALYQTSQFICSHSQNYPHDFVLFQRFCFDFISLSGTLLYQLTLSQYEYLLRKVFAQITYYDTIMRELSFRRLDEIGPGITIQVLEDITTTLWSKRKAQIKEEFLKTLAEEQEESRRIKSQMERATAEENGDGNEGRGNDFDPLINLNELAEKAKEEEALKRENQYIKEKKPKPQPFVIDGIVKEDLNIVLYKDFAAQQAAAVSMFGETQMNFTKKQQHKPLNQPKNSQVKIMPQSKSPVKARHAGQHVARSQPPLPTIQQVMADQQQQAMKTVLMYKQFMALAKNKDESDDENEDEKEAQRKKEELEKKKRQLTHKIHTPVLIDSSESGDDATPRLRKGPAQPIEEAASQSEHTRAGPERENSAKEHSIDGSQIEAGGAVSTHGDEQFVKYVWNKKTKRLERRDMRLTTNFDKIDKKKLQNFSKVNEKSKILCMQLEENYFNSTLMPQAIAGDGDVNFKEIQEEMIYGPNDLKKRQGLGKQPSPTMKEQAYQQMPAYQKHLLNATTNQQQQPTMNLMNKKRRISLEAKTRTDNYSTQPNTSPFLNNAKQANQKMVASREGQQEETDQSLVDKKLAIIRMALRGVATDTDARTQLTEYLENGGGQKDSTNFKQVAIAFSKNQALFGQNSNNSQMGQTATSNLGGALLNQNQRPQSLLETRDIFMRTKYHEIQQNNKKLILSQREQLKTSMMGQTNFSFNKKQYIPNQPGDGILPQLEATQARIYNHPNMLKPQEIGKHTSPHFTHSRAMNGGRQSNLNFMSSPLKIPTNKTPLSNGNISVKLKIQNVTPQTGGNFQRGYQQRPSHPGALYHFNNNKDGFQSSPRSSNNNLDIIEYGVLTLNKEQLLKLQAQLANNPNHESQHGIAQTFRDSVQDQVEYNKEDAKEERSLEVKNSQIDIRGSQHAHRRDSVDVVQIQNKPPTRQKPAITPLNLEAINISQNASEVGRSQVQNAENMLEYQKLHQVNRTQPYINPLTTSNSSHGGNILEMREGSRISQANNHQHYGAITHGVVKLSKSPFDHHNHYHQYMHPQDFDDNVNDPLLMMVPLPNPNMPPLQTMYKQSGGFSIMGGMNQMDPRITTQRSGMTVKMSQQQQLKKTSYINQLPMQDFQLEQWRIAYKNINSATRHFYTGSSFPITTAQQH